VDKKNKVVCLSEYAYSWVTTKTWRRLWNKSAKWRRSKYKVFAKFRLQLLACPILLLQYET